MGTQVPLDAKGTAVEHVVFFPASDGTPAFRRLASFEEAVRLVEHLRNVEGVEQVTVHALTEVPLAFRAYYRVEVSGAEAPGVGVPGDGAPVPPQARPAAPPPAVAPQPAALAAVPEPAPAEVARLEAPAQAPGLAEAPALVLVEVPAQAAQPQAAHPQPAHSQEAQPQAAQPQAVEPQAVEPAAASNGRGRDLGNSLGFFA